MTLYTKLGLIALIAAYIGLLYWFMSKIHIIAANIPERSRYDTSDRQETPHHSVWHS